ncbi:MAG: ubiquinone/menaquinone biosynthesis methyltransferase [Chthoniobacterales bacterium]|nr:ubiquinone/menaquinone biosynthesis methyltransferase [Chthoniobacterales bacterium]
MNPEYVKDLFCSIAGRYALVNHLLSGGLDFWWRHCVAKKVQLWNPKNILDVATGNGELAFDLRKKLPNTEIIGVDFCAPMLEQARLKQIQRAQKKITAKSIAFLEADGLSLPYEEKSFDVVTISFGLRNMASWEDGLREIYRILRPGGHLLILDFSLPTSSLLRPAYRFYLHHLLPHLAGWVTGNSNAYEYMGGSIEAFPSGKKMLSLLKKCDFFHATADPMTFGIVTIYTAAKMSS